MNKVAAGGGGHAHRRGGGHAHRLSSTQMINGCLVTAAGQEKTLRNASDPPAARRHRGPQTNTDQTRELKLKRQSVGAAAAAAIRRSGAPLK